MKKSFISLSASLLASAMLFIGCSSINPTQTASAVKIAATVGVNVAVQKDPTLVPYFKAADLAIKTLVLNAQYDPASLNAILAAVSVPTNQWAAYQLGCGVAVEIYDVYASNIASNLDKTVYLKPVLQGLATGIEQGLGTNMTVQTLQLQRHPKK